MEQECQKVTERKGISSVLTAATCMGMMKRCSVSGDPCEAALGARGAQVNECSSPEAAL